MGFKERLPFGSKEKEITISPDLSLAVKVTLESCFENQVARLLIPADRAKVKEFLLSFVTTTRVYLIRTKEQLEAIWNNARENEVVVDFLLGMAIDLRFQLPILHDGDEHGLEEVIQRLTKAIGDSNQTAVDSAIDDDLKERFPKEKSFGSLIAANHWYVVLLLFDQNRTLIERLHIPAN